MDSTCCGVELLGMGSVAKLTGCSFKDFKLFDSRPLTDNSKVYSCGVAAAGGAEVSLSGVDIIRAELGVLAGLSKVRLSRCSVKAQVIGALFRCECTQNCA